MKIVSLSISDDTSELSCTEDELHNVLYTLCNKYDFNILVDMVYRCNSPDLPLKYMLLNMENTRRISVVVKVKGMISSVSNIWKGAVGLESELTRRHKLRFVDEKGDLYLLDKQVCNHEQDMDIFVNPYMFKVKGNADRVSSIWIDNDTNFRNLEQDLQDFTLFEVNSMLCRLGRFPFSSGQLLWFKMVEDLCNIKLSDRAIAFRMVFLELARIFSHLDNFKNTFKSFNTFSYNNCRDLNMKLLSLFGIVGNLPFRLGGMTQDLSQEWCAQCFSVLDTIGTDVLRIRKAFVRAPVFMERQDILKFSGEESISYGHTGPVLRACGINYDLRKNTPYYFYSDLDFNIPLGNFGNAYDRFMVRLSEIEESISIITQLLENLPTGEVLPQTGVGQKYSVPSGVSSYYSAIEAPNGELGVHVIFDKSGILEDVKFRSPCLSMYESFPRQVVGEFIEDVEAAFHSLGIRSVEMER